MGSSFTSSNEIEYFKIIEQDRAEMSMMVSTRNLSNESLRSIIFDSDEKTFINYHPLKF